MLKQIAIASLAGIAASGAWAGTVQLLPGSQVSNSINTSSDIDNVSSLPFAATGGVSDSSGSSNGSYNLSQARFDIAINQLSFTRAFNGVASGELLFSAVGDLDYLLTTSFSESNGLTTTARIDLIDLSTGVVVASNGNDGPFSPWEQNAAGSLPGGRSYSLQYQFESAWAGLPPNAYARSSLGIPTLNTGSISALVQFEFEPAVVPLPAAAWMGLALLGSMGVAGYVQNRRARVCIAN